MSRTAGPSAQSQGGAVARAQRGGAVAKTQRGGAVAKTQRVGAEVGEEVRKALAVVLRSANTRPQTVAEVRALLRARDVTGEVADEAVRLAERLGALDDAKLARAWVEERGLRRGFGSARLRDELSRRQVPEHLVDDALMQLDGRDDLAAATELARTRVRQLPASLPPEAVARRLAAYLARRGHPPALAQRVAVEVSGLREQWD